MTLIPMSLAMQWSRDPLFTFGPRSPHDPIGNSGGSLASNAPLRTTTRVAAQANREALARRGGLDAMVAFACVGLRRDGFGGRAGGGAGGCRRAAGWDSAVGGISAPARA